MRNNRESLFYGEILSLDCIVIRILRRPSIFFYCVAQSEMTEGMNIGEAEKKKKYEAKQKYN